MFEKRDLSVEREVPILPFVNLNDELLDSGAVSVFETLRNHPQFVVVVVHWSGLEKPVAFLIVTGGIFFLSPVEQVVLASPLLTIFLTLFLFGVKLVQRDCFVFFA